MIESDTPRTDAIQERCANEDLDVELAMSESPKTKSDVVGVGCDDLLAQKRLQLKTARRESKKAAMRGRHNWGDFYRNQHIKELEREIQILRANSQADRPQGSV
jgi:hypothetical protein